jgi:hypothetical protein
MRPGWRQAGPTNFAGRIKSLAIDPRDGSTLYAGAADGGVWKTNDGGRQWWPLFLHELSFAMGSLAVAPSANGVVYAATGEDVDGWGPSYDGVGVYRSTDAGQTWALTAAGPGSRCGRVVVGASDPSHVVAASNLGLYHSPDGGASWSLRLSGHVTDVVADPGDPDNTFVAAVWNDGVYRSTDGGLTWTRRNGTIHAHLPGGTAAGWIRLAAGRIFGQSIFLAKMGPLGGDIYRSSPDLATWYFVGGGIEGVKYNQWTNLIACKPDDPLVVFAGGVGLQRTDSSPPASNWGAIHWNAVGGTHSDHHALAFDPGDFAVCYLATDGGVYKSTDTGATWAISSNGLIATQLYSIGVWQSGDFLLGGATQDQGIICNRGTSGSDWIDTGAGNEGGLFVVDENNGDNAFCTPWDSTFQRSTDRAVSWTNLVQSLKNSLGVFTDPSVSAIAVQPGDSSVAVAAFQCHRRRPRPHTEHDIIRSLDQGNTWTYALTKSEAFTAISFAPSDSTVCYATTDGGSVYRSSDGGASWNTPYAAGAGPVPGAITCLAVSWGNSNNVYAGYGNFGPGDRIWRTQDGGAHWVDATGSGPNALPAIPINSVAVDDHDDHTAYAATDIGVFVTRDAGASWQDFGGGWPGLRLPRVVVSGLALERNGRRLFASTMGRGVFYRPL